VSQPGKQLTPEVVDLVVHLNLRYVEERKAARYVSTRNPTRRTAEGLGLGERTIKRIMAGHARCKPTHQARRPGRPHSSIDIGLQPAVREFVRIENLSGQRVSVARVRSYLADEFQVDIPKMTLWRALKRWGFTYGQGHRRDSLKEKDYLIQARREYLRLKRKNRGPNELPKRPEVYLDETFINKNHSARYTWYKVEDGPWVNKPSGVGPRLIVVHAMTSDGWVKVQSWCFKRKREPATITVK